MFQFVFHKPCILKMHKENNHGDLNQGNMLATNTGPQTSGPQVYYSKSQTGPSNTTPKLLNRFHNLTYLLCKKGFT